MRALFFGPNLVNRSSRTFLGATWIFTWLAVSSAMAGPVVDTSSDLRLIPFPKQVQLTSESFDLRRRLVVEISQDQAELLGEQISAELQAAGFAAPRVRPLKTAVHLLRLSGKPRWTLKRLSVRSGAAPEEYELKVQGNEATVAAASPGGLFYGAQTLRQLIRANRHQDRLPGVEIHDWPSLTWRGFQDDLTRGPSTTLQNLKEQAALGAFLKLNVFTYYMEHQFAFRKHPQIGPKDGSLTGEELGELVKAAEPLHLNILGNQQSFGHFGAILAHPEFSNLRETPNLLCPLKEQSYQLLDDLYGETIPLLPFGYFNVCCDETDGLGEGPSKALADRIGVGGVYVQHVRRVHELISGKYGKRMMMWGDIILRHPDRLQDVPKDTVMLTWGYDPRASFEDQIVPFQAAGFEFWICPGVSCWNRVLPWFGGSATNIQRFVRDGVKHGAAGMLNTAWDDDGESFNAPNWFGFAWGAECAWNDSSTSLEQFNRRIGSVLFGEPCDTFGRGVERLMGSDLDGLPTAKFWQFDFGPIRVRSVEAGRVSLEKSLACVQGAVAQFEACQRQAVVNADVLEYFLFGARRISLYVERELHRLNAAEAYRNARKMPVLEAQPKLQAIEDTLRADRDAHGRLARRYAELWLCENKPYALDAPLARFSDIIVRYDAEIQRLERARASAKPDRSLPTPREVGLELIEEGR